MCVNGNMISIETTPGRGREENDLENGGWVNSSTIY
jgi:hypothetical protein